MIKYYLDEDAIIPNVPTYVCYDEKERKYVLANLDKLVVKAANESGGYGMLVGPHATERGTRQVCRLDRRESAQLHRPTDAVAVASADDCRRSL